MSMCTVSDIVILIKLRPDTSTTTKHEHCPVLLYCIVKMRGHIGTDLL